MQNQQVEVFSRNSNMSVIPFLRPRQEDCRTKIILRTGVVVHTFNPNLQKAEARESLWDRGQPGLQSEPLDYVETLFLKK